MTIKQKYNTISKWHTTDLGYQHSQKELIRKIKDRVYWEMEVQNTKVNLKAIREA